jgi:hypothetical protein
MKTSFRATVRKGTQLVAALSLLACIAASCGPERSVARGPHCAFADAEVMTSLGICNIAAEYYVAHKEWPLSKTQVEQQWSKMLEEAKQEMPPEEAAEGAEFLKRFTLLELTKKGDNLLLRYRFKVDTKTVRQRVTLKPGSTADEILRAATDAQE